MPRHAVSDDDEPLEDKTAALTLKNKKTERMKRKNATRQQKRDAIVNITKLPTELILETLKYLLPHDVLEFSSVNRRFNSIVEANANDHLAYHDDAMTSTYALYKEKKTGILSTFPFGIFGYARLDERLQDSPLWTDAPREPGRDPMGLTPSQPNIEFWNTELYGGPKQYADFPIDHKQAFAMCALLITYSL
jgi:hypothetical protein